MRALLAVAAFSAVAAAAQSAAPAIATIDVYGSSTFDSARARAELGFPVSDLVAAFDFLGSSDRNKAGYTLAALAAQPQTFGDRDYAVWERWAAQSR